MERQVASIVDAWPREVAKKVMKRPDKAPEIIARVLGDLERLRADEFVALVRSSLRACASCCHAEEKHGNLARGAAYHCAENVAGPGQETKACGCAGYVPDEVGSSADKFYYAKIRQLNTITDDVAFAILLGHREFAEDAIKAWLEERRQRAR